MTDIVYIFGHGSKWDNNELRYSLRSVEKHLSNVGNVYLVGNAPEFISGVIAIPFKETCHKLENIINKTLAACNHPDISENFICYYDDHFLLSDFDADNFPCFHKGELREHAQRAKGNYRKLILNTERALLEVGRTTLSFNVHCPQPINKKLFKIPPPETLVKSIYGNTTYVDVAYSPDYKLFEKKSTGEYLNQLKEAKFFSISDKAMCKGLHELFQILYPKPSKYETWQ